MRFNYLPNFTGGAIAPGTLLAARETALRLVSVSGASPLVLGPIPTWPARRVGRLRFRFVGAAAPQTLTVFAGVGAYQLPRNHVIPVRGGTTELVWPNQGRLAVVSVRSIVSDVAQADGIAIDLMQWEAEACIDAAVMLAGVYPGNARASLLDGAYASLVAEGPTTIRAAEDLPAGADLVSAAGGGVRTMQAGDTFADRVGKSLSRCAAGELCDVDLLLRAAR